MWSRFSFVRIANCHHGFSALHTIDLCLHFVDLLLTLRSILVHLFLVIGCNLLSLLLEHSLILLNLLVALSLLLLHQGLILRNLLIAYRHLLLNRRLLLLNLLLTGSVGLVGSLISRGGTVVRILQL